jgi:TPP-dependent pyruvate/acetoin dehydrogenase alpha subunit
MDRTGLEDFLRSARDNEFPVDEYEDLREAAIDYHVYRTVAELLGKQAGYCKGRGGGMHIADFSVGNLGANAIVGGSMAIGTGAALGADRLGEGRVVVCCVGDGAMNNGIAHEAMNFSTLGQFKHGLPIIFFVENNQYGYTGQQKKEVTDVEFLSQRGVAYNAEGMHAETVCGMNVLSVRDALRRAKALCLKGEGPVLIEAETYRHWGHNFKDKGRLHAVAEKDVGRKRPVDWFRPAGDWIRPRRGRGGGRRRAGWSRDDARGSGRDPDPRHPGGLWASTSEGR